MSSNRDFDDAGGDTDDGDAPSRREVPEYEARVLLDGASPRIVLARLHDGDPLELWPRTLELLRESWILADPKLVCLRTMARVAYASMKYRGKPPLAEWIAQLQRQSLGEVLEEEREAAYADAMPPPDADPRFDYLSRALGIEPALARRGCVAFNTLPPEVRCVYYAIVVDRRKVKQFIEESGLTRDQVRQGLRRALAVIDQAIAPKQANDVDGEEAHG